MKVKELIAALRKMPQDLEVYGYCDHGQIPEKVCPPSVAYTPENLEHSIWEGYYANKEEVEDADFVNMFVLL